MQAGVPVPVASKIFASAPARGTPIDPFAAHANLIRTTEALNMTAQEDVTPSMLIRLENLVEEAAAKLAQLKVAI